MSTVVSWRISGVAQGFKETSPLTSRTVLEISLETGEEERMENARISFDVIKKRRKDEMKKYKKDMKDEQESQEWREGSREKKWNEGMREGENVGGGLKQDKSSI